MKITKLELLNFRNYEKQKIKFNNNINIFYGDNAQGKTNIIESIFISAFGKSFRTSREKELIKYSFIFRVCFRYIINNDTYKKNWKEYKYKERKS